MSLIEEVRSVCPNATNTVKMLAGEEFPAIVGTIHVNGVVYNLDVIQGQGPVYVYLYQKGEDDFKEDLCYYEAESDTFKDAMYHIYDDVTRASESLHRQADALDGLLHSIRGRIR